MLPHKLIQINFLTIVWNYNIQHPTDSMIVRNGAYWTIFEHNISK